MSTAQREATNEADEGTESTHARSASPVVYLASVVVVALAIYLSASMVWARTIPRPTFLPKPAAGASWHDRDCGIEHTPDWVARDGFWRPVVWSTLVGCI